jgi:hypothetical protein
MPIYRGDRAYPNVSDTVSALQSTKASGDIRIRMRQYHKVDCGDAVRIKAFYQFTGIGFCSGADDNDLAI